MPGTERDDTRWEASLELARECNQALIELRKMVQRGLEAVGLEQAQQARRLGSMESDVKKLTAIEHDCIERLTRLEAKEGVNDKHRKAVLYLLIACGLALLVILYLAYRIAGVFGVV